MKRATSIAIAAGTCAAALIIAATVFVARMAQLAAKVAPVDNSSFEFEPHPGARLPLSASLIDESGRVVVLGDFFTKSPVILVLEYLRCTSLCGVTLRNLADVLDHLPLAPARDYQIVAVSIDPRDTPADAAAAGEQYRLGRGAARDGMHFLTSTSAAPVQAIASTIGFPYRYEPALDAYIHPAGFVVATPDGAISRYFEGAAVSGPELIGAFADAQADKSLGPLARLLLICHAQAEPLGRFTVPVLAAFTVADIAAGLSALAIFAAVRRRRYG